MDYLLIDANNLAVRAAFANSELRNRNGIPTGVHYGVFSSLISLKNQFVDYEILLAWDGHSQRRIEEAESAMKKGLVPSGYKANRIKDEQPEPLKHFREQAPHLKKGLEQTGIPQIRLENFEADDVIAAYAKKLRNENKVVIVTTDRDYYQLLHPNVKMWNGMKSQYVELDKWQAEFGITPDQYVHCGALMGDVGDNIFGIPGWGEKTALKAICEHGSFHNLYEELHKKYDGLREDYPDVVDDEFKKLAGIVTKSNKPKYPDIKAGFPFTGVALAVEEKKIKSIPKATLMALMFEERVSVAFSLKKMDDEIDGLPDFKKGPANPEKLLEYFDYYDIQSLKSEVDAFKE